MDLNVLKDFPYRPRYYITHPWKWFRECWINLKNAWYRMTRGYCYTDLWNIDDWFLAIFPKMLRELAEKHCAYPGVEPFETPEKWEIWLKEMADKIEYLQKDSDEKENEYAGLFHIVMEERRKFESAGESITVTYTLNDNDFEELRTNYYRREREIAEAKHEAAKKIGTELFTYLYYLWD